MILNRPTKTPVFCPLMSLPVFPLASNQLPQQLISRRVLVGRSRKLSMIHLPSFPGRSRHQGDQNPGRAPLSDQGDRSGRREAIPPSRDAARTSAGSRSGTSASKVSPAFQSCVEAVLVHVRIRDPFTASSGSSDPSTLFQWTLPHFS